MNTVVTLVFHEEGSPKLISVGNPPLIVLFKDGHTKLSAEYTPDAAAQVFWQAIQTVQECLGKSELSPGSIALTLPVLVKGV